MPFCLRLKDDCKLHNFRSVTYSFQQSNGLDQPTIQSNHDAPSDPKNVSFAVLQMLLVPQWGAKH